MNFWVVGADWEREDKSKKFIEDGVWINGYTDKYLDVVKTIAVGDKIAIKAAYVQKNNLPFNNHNCFVSCMKIKAVGEVIAN